MTSITNRSEWLRLLLGLVLVFSLFQWTAATLGSDFGQWGFLIAALVVAATIAVERVLFGQRVLSAARSLGLGVPRMKGLLVAGGVALLLFLIVLLFGRAAEARLALLPGWVSLVGGLFAQAGIAEEILFRGYLFGHLRRGRSFWNAAVASMVPFVAVHLFLFLTMPWPIALAAVLLSVVLSFPFAYLFELGGSTIWAPALLHFVIQGTVKVVVFSDDGGVSFPLVWMVASAIASLLILLVKPPRPAMASRADPDN